MTWSNVKKRESSLGDAILRAGPALRQRLATRHVELGGSSPHGLSKEQDDERQTANGSGPETQPKVSPPVQENKRMVLQPSSFYSRRRLEAVEEHILQFLARVHTRASGRTLSYRAVWVLHPTQRAAFDHADRLNDGLRDDDPQYSRVWSLETGNDGKRRFLAASAALFWARYLGWPEEQRHAYEIIQEDHPCNIYFDLEYAIENNPEADGARAAEELLQRLETLLQGKLGFAFDPGKDVLELDSSTETKFSRHIIVALPGAAFLSNAHVGALVRDLCALIWEAHGRGETTACVVKGSQGDLCLLVDQAVYSRNRAFRLPLSSKFGKTAVLRCTGRFGGQGLSDKEVFEQSLICRPGSNPGLQFVQWGEESERQCSLASNKLPRRHPSRSPSICYGPCPFPELADFIVQVCKQGAAFPKAAIRSWSFLPEGPIMLYNITGCRYCTHINREHKSNGIFYVVDLSGGAWTQRCYDPDCRTFRMPFTALPLELHNACLLKLDELDRLELCSPKGCHRLEEEERSRQLEEDAAGNSELTLPSDTEMLEALKILESEG